MLTRRALTKLFLAAVAAGFALQFDLGDIVPSAFAAGRGMTESTYMGRSFLLYKPSSVPEGKKMPLLIVLHGGLGNADYIAKELGMNQVAEKRGFMVAYLNGTGGQRFMKNMRTWNAGGGCCGSALKENTDDIGFIQGFIKDMSAKYPVDADRLYMAGHSNGAMMGYRFVCEKPGVVAAFVSVSGTLTASNQCHLPGLQVLDIHGENDQNVPVEGGVGRKSVTKLNYRSAYETNRILKDAGASIQMKIVPGAGHNIGDISQKLLSSEGATLAETMERFLRGKNKTSLQMKP
ncbi:MAG: PHB depolymerase family esterase [Pseudomonadota bacterium]